MTSDQVVTWVHPSVRDLVIDRLMDDEARRRGFLSHMGGSGLELALSQGGGSLGERALPLLKTAEDWQLLEVRTRELLSDPTTTRKRDLILAITAALSFASEHGDIPLQQRLRTVLTSALEALRAIWDDEASAISNRDLHTFLRASVDSDPLVACPQLRRTWDVRSAAAETVATSDEMDTSVVAPIKAWLGLATMLREYEPRWLKSLHFPDRYSGLVEQLQQLMADWVNELQRLEEEEEDSEGPPIAPDETEEWEQELLEEVQEALKLALEVVPDAPASTRRALRHAEEHAGIRGARRDRWEAYEGERYEGDYSDYSDRGRSSTIEISAIFSDL